MISKESIIQRLKRLKPSDLLNLSGIAFGFLATIFLAKALFATTEEMLKDTFYGAVNWAYPSVDLLTKKATPMYDTVVAIGFSLATLITQGFSIFTKKYKFARLGIIISSIFLIIGFCIAPVVKKRAENKAKFDIAKNYLRSNFEKPIVPLYSGVEAIAIDYFSFDKELNETNLEFVQRFAGFLKYDIPPNADFSKWQ